MTVRAIMLALFLFSLTNCTTLGERWRNFVNGGVSPAPAAPQPLTYNEQNNVEPSIYRQYHHVTAADLERQAHLGSDAGSLWVMQGQGAYLFSQNTVHMVGDPIPIILNGDPQAQLAAKAQVIAKLLAQLAARRRMIVGLRAPSSTSNAPANTAVKGAKGAAAKSPALNNPGSNYAFKVHMVPARVVGRLVNGNYRVRGLQTFLIGPREYKVIVSGIVRSEDFNDQGIDATQLLNGNFDIVSAKGADLGDY